MRVAKPYISLRLASSSLVLLLYNFLKIKKGIKAPQISNPGMHINPMNFV